MVVEAGFPIERTEIKSDKIQFGSFPTGKYLSVIHIGDYKNLNEAHMYLENYSKSNNVALYQSTTDTGVLW
jgi:hypothetical protein